MMHTGKSILKLVQVNQIWIIICHLTVSRLGPTQMPWQITLFRLIFRLTSNQSEMYIITIQILFNLTSKRSRSRYSFASEKKK